MDKNFSLSTTILNHPDDSEQKNVIKTDQSFVHIAHNITIRQYKFWHLFLKTFGELIELDTPPDSDGLYYCSLKTISNYFGYEINRTELRADLESLRVAPIVINFLEKDGMPAEHAMGFISEFKVLSRRVGFKLPSAIERVIRNTEQKDQMFLLLNWSIFNSFKGKYESVIYKLCRDYLGVGRTPYFTVDKYREYMGIQDSEYKEFKELNRWVIKKPLLALSKSDLCDIDIEVVYQKRGQSVVGLYFTVRHSNQKLLDLNPLPSSEIAFQNSLVDIAPSSQKKYLDQFDANEINASIIRANAYISDLQEQGRDVKIMAIYHSAITNRWGLPEIGEEKIREAKKQEEQKRIKQEKLNQKRIQEEEALKSLQEEKILLDFLLLDADTQHHLMVKTIDKVKGIKKAYKTMSDLYNEYGVEAYHHLPLFRGHLIIVLKDYFETINQSPNQELF